MTSLDHFLKWDPEDRRQWEQFLSREWLVTNGLGGYASGTVVGVPTRRYHGALVAALTAPFGRVMMFNRLAERVVFGGGATVQFGRNEQEDIPGSFEEGVFPAEFRLEWGLPVWRYESGGFVLEKRLVLRHRQNTVHICYSVVSGDGSLKLQIEPSLHFRKHDELVSGPLDDPFRLSVIESRIEISNGSRLPALRILTQGSRAQLVLHGGSFQELYYRAEARRGYDCHERLWSPGYFEADLKKGDSVTVTGSTEPWDTIQALAPEEAFEAECLRRRRLIEAAHPQVQAGAAAETVLAADQFLIAPVGRPEDTARAHAAGEEMRTAIAGYHWFTDWGRDTMISLEGLALLTGRVTEAGWILRTFAQYIVDGLVPNMFPEGENRGQYNTADATLWFFHAIDRYLQFSGDSLFLPFIIPKLEDIVKHHLRGTRFGIGVDPKDGLLRQGDEEWPLTWMDAKVNEWVVTPRRGKAVEINALWYNALRLLERWLREQRGDSAAREPARLADQVYESFNHRFWYAKGEYLYDLVDGERGDDPACRPNQLFAISLPHPVLEPSRWLAVVETVRERLLTPVGLRSLAPGDPQYQPRYDGDLRSRDAAYHQGTVWGWLIGPFIDAWMRAYPQDHDARRFLQGLVLHLDKACVGSMSEVFDAESPYTPRGCIAQAWTVAEFLRAWLKTAPMPA